MFKMPSRNKIMKERFRDKVKLKKRNELLSELNYMEMLSIGIIDKIFFNGFIQEAVQLLINAIFLMEDGYFDCAFYSARQSQEVINNMLYLASDRTQLEKWKHKEKFPMNNQVLKKLEELNYNYKEFKTIFADFFDEYEKLNAQSNKTIHKQGIDSFYEMRVKYAQEIHFNKTAELELFSKIISYSICHLYLLYILLDPLGLILADEELNKKLHFAPSTEPININYLKQNFPMDFVSLLKTTEFYKSLIDTFGMNEDMNDAMYDLIRESYFDLDNLDMIANQIHLIDCYGKFVFNILSNGYKISNFYFNYISILPDFWTSIPSNHKQNHWSKEESDKYKFTNPTFNVQYHNVFLSAVPMFEDEMLIMEHNEIISDDDINILNKMVSEQNEMHKKMIEEMFANLDNASINNKKT